MITLMITLPPPCRYVYDARRQRQILPLCAIAITLRLHCCHAATLLRDKMPRYVMAPRAAAPSPIR